MSSSSFDNVVVPGDIIRDFMYTNSGAVGERHNTELEFGSLGLDVFIHNRGAAALTIAFSGQGPVTVDAGDAYALNGVKFNLIVVTSAVLYDLQIFGVRASTLKRMGLLRL